MARPYFLNLMVKVMAGGSVDMLKDYVDCDHPLDGLHVRLHHNVDVVELTSSLEAPAPAAYELILTFALYLPGP